MCASHLLLRLLGCVALLQGGDTGQQASGGRDGSAADYESEGGIDTLLRSWGHIW
jgi:hypothetical protein